MTNPTAIAVDDGAGHALWAGQQVAAINYAGKSLLLTEPDQIVSWPMPEYESVLVGTEADGSGGTYNYYRTVLESVRLEDVLASFPAGGTVKVRYRESGGDQTAEETAVLASLSIDLTKGYAETITPGSARFRLGNSLYTHQANAIYRDPSPATGAGSLAGSLDPTTGKVLPLTSWTAGGANTVTLEALVTEVGGQPVDACVFRTPVAPIRSGTFQIRWTDLTGTGYDKTLDGSGVLEDADCSVTIDYPRGVVRARFGRWREVSGLTPEDLAAPWYSAGSIVNRGGVHSIWQSHPALAASIVYNAVAQTMLPPDSNLLGLDAARLPPDGRALIYRVGMLALIHHTDSFSAPGVAQLPRRRRELRLGDALHRHPAGQVLQPVRADELDRVWSDTRIGDQPLASFNDALFPIAVTNAGAYPDRFLVRFITSTDFQVIGEALGLIGVGDIGHDCAPVNPLTGKPYFTIPYQGWGGGWATGNCLRFNLAGACYPVDAVRAVQPSEPTGLRDSVELLLVGNVDA